MKEVSTSHKTLLLVPYRDTQLAVDGVGAVGEEPDWNQLLNRSEGSLLELLDAISEMN